jgi:hypothetical protein
VSHGAGCALDAVLPVLLNSRSGGKETAN